jgi:hypothetical protein
MPASSPVQNAVESITSMGKFAPEAVVPDVEGYLEHLADPITALSAALKTFADHLSGMPVHPSVAEAIKNMIPGLSASAEAAGEVFTLFKAKHGPELDQHYNPRPQERAWNVNA